MSASLGVAGSAVNMTASQSCRQQGTAAVNFSRRSQLRLEHTNFWQVALILRFVWAASFYMYCKRSCCLPVALLKAVVPVSGSCLVVPHWTCPRKAILLHATQPPSGAAVLHNLSCMNNHMLCCSQGSLLFWTGNMLQEHAFLQLLHLCSPAQV